MTWLSILRLGLVQAALGSIAVIVTSTMNRVMTVEIGLPAFIPGALVALHYGVQVLRPRFGHGADRGGRQTPWIVGGMAVLALGATLAAAAIGMQSRQPVAGIALAVVAYMLVGLGIGASGTSLLALLAARVGPRRRAAAATVVWLMMILGMAVTGQVAGRLLSPFSLPRLLEVTVGAGGIALILAILATFRVERAAAIPAAPVTPPRFAVALRDVWAEPEARGFALFVFVSMLAYSAQELVIEPFAGAILHLAPGETARLTGTQHGGAFLGMLACGLLGSLPRFAAMRLWVVGGCAGSALAIAALAIAGTADTIAPLLFILGVANGAFAVAAIGAMMGFAQSGRAGRGGTRMGLFGAAQAVGFACGSLFAGGANTGAHALLGPGGQPYTLTFAAEATLFLLAALLATRVFRPATEAAPPNAIPLNALATGG